MEIIEYREDGTRGIEAGLSGEGVIDTRVLMINTNLRDKISIAMITKILARINIQVVKMGMVEILTGEEEVVTEDGGEEEEEDIKVISLVHMLQLFS